MLGTPGNWLYRGREGPWSNSTVWHLSACFQLLVVLLFISNRPQAIGSPSESPGILPVVSWPLEPQDGPVGVGGGEHVPQPQCWVDVVGNVPGARGGDILGGQQKVQV